MAQAYAVTRGPRHHSFGYYDKSPWDATGRYLLALQAPFSDRAPTADDVAILGVIDLVNGDRFAPFAETRAWNWQQGCMLQWLPGAADRLVLYNDRDGDRFVAVLCDALTGHLVRRLPLPAYAVSHDGRQAVTLNFSRLHHQRPGYGYAGVPDPWREVREPEDDGIYWMDLETGRYRLVFSIAEAASLKRTPSMDGAVHRFNHLQFSPDDARFVFLHRWRPPAAARASLGRRVRGATRGLGQLLTRGQEYAGIGVSRRLRLGVRGLRRVLGRRYGMHPADETRLNTARPDGSALAIVADEGIVSHFDWRDPAHILAWARYRGTEGFFVFEDRAGDAVLVDPQAMPGDGHASYSPDAEQRWILNDTLPDHEDCRTLYLYDCLTRRRKELGRFSSPPGLVNDFRCDLHPRWSRDGSQVCIDSAHDGSRQLYVIDVSPVKGES